MSEEVELKKPKPITIDKFVNQYAEFAAKLVKAEEEQKIPTQSRSSNKRIHEAFRFWYVDCRDREDISREIDLRKIENSKPSWE